MLSLTTRSRRAPLVLLLAPILGVAPSFAQAPIPAYLECYKITDSMRLSGVVDLDSLPSGVQPGCIVSPAKLFCAAATASVVAATDKLSRTPITPLSFSAPGAQDHICYKLRCPTPGSIAGQQATDEFGTRTVTRLIPSVLCTPAAAGEAYCGDGAIAPGEDCDGANLAGATCHTLGFAAGTLKCAPGCRFDTSACVPNPPPGSCDLQTLAAGEPTPTFVTGVLPCSLDCLVQHLLALPHIVFPTGQLAGYVTIGTVPYPQTTYLAASGGTTVTGNVSGAGILIVDGDLTVQGTLSYWGLVIVLGTTTVTSSVDGAGNVTIYGALLSRDLNVAAGSGGVSLVHSTDALGLASGLAGDASSACP